MFDGIVGKSLIEWFGVVLAIVLGTAERRRREIGKVG